MFSSVCSVLAAPDLAADGFWTNAGYAVLPFIIAMVTVGVIARQLDDGKDDDGG